MEQEPGMSKIGIPLYMRKNHIVVVVGIVPTHAPYSPWRFESKLWFANTLSEQTVFLERTP